MLLLPLLLMSAKAPVAVLDCPAEFIFNAIRWETDINATGEFKINNNAKPFYARKFMKEHPQYNGFFRKRHSKAD